MYSHEGWQYPTHLIAKIAPVIYHNFFAKSDELSAGRLKIRYYSHIDIRFFDT